ncbi:DNA polymerase III subunit delta [Pusillimonas sp. SM2304]|uniref:DNA polymerase III subunit delta n=1 Tax=Pusillimonas sp. SM2304 TaxID=3073241 RepID=UPI0028762082|nr:DNA polymerase III subunit delta [Pusillimonas sp. SM2304]MDS1140998.1 DNA polymerase III subunit delta [Pusillimonas sp. SM2304]
MGRRLDADSLSSLLKKTPPPTLDTLYVVSGDEPLLIIEASDALRAAAAQAGYTERVSLTLDARGDWSAVIGATQNVSLFGDRRLVDLSIPTGKPGKTGAETLLKLAGMAESGALADTLVMVNLPRLDKTTRNTKWAQGLFDAGTAIEVASIERAALPRWIAHRLARQDQQLDTATLEWMADKVEGNLLAAHQEVQKLGLLYPPGKISGPDVERAVLNVARYDVFGLRDAMLAGNAAKALAMLSGLRAEGEALPLVLWAVGEEVRVLARLAAAQAAGGDMQAEMRRQRVFGPREHLLRQTLGRLPQQAWPAAVQHAHDIDRLIKGLKVPGRLDDPWEELGRLALRIALARRPAQT